MHPFAKGRRGSVADLGEGALIAAIRRWLGGSSPPSPFGIGDDCAVLPAIARRPLVTVDPVIYGRHFDGTAPAEAVGAKLMKRNLSDVAAMGGRPLAAVIALALDPRVRLDWIERFYGGLAACARRHRVGIVGGDVAEAPGILAATLTLVGEAAPSRVLSRSGARIGDGIYVTGVLGRSLASGHHLAFEPRLAEGAWCAARSAVRAMIDVSDGLAKDLRALTPRGGAPAIDPASVPLRPGAGVDAALDDGEDYELLFALDGRTDARSFERAWRRRFPKTRLSRIGRFVPKRSLPPGALALGGHRGYEHFGR